MAVTSANRYLTRAEMEGNAEYISAYLLTRGWSLPAIAAMLGNMETESTINPGIYESLDDTSDSNGFGLVQWTPNTKLKEWADVNGFGGNYGDIDVQLLRILYEVNIGAQWIATDKYEMTFKAFTTSTLAPEYLAQAFLYNYERPADLNQPNRSTQARAWYTFLGGDGGGTVNPTPTEQKPMSKLLLYFAGTRRR